jgi:hypothetical protein
MLFSRRGQPPYRGSVLEAEDPVRGREETRMPIGEYSVPQGIRE